MGQRGSSGKHAQGMLKVERDKFSEPERHRRSQVAVPSESDRHLDEMEEASCVVRREM